MFISVFCGSLFSNRSGNQLKTLARSDCLFPANCILLIVILNVFIQSIPSKGVISVLSIISISIFCLLFSYSTSTGIFPPNFHFVFVDILVPVCYFLFLGWSYYFSSVSNIGIGDPVSIVNSFLTPFILIVAL